jgi:ligand-binding sensor domain-containing protein
VTIFAILEDRSGTIWVSGLRRPNARLCSIKEDQVHCDGDDGKFGESVSSLYEDKAGNLWVGSSTGLWHWSPGSPKLYPNQSTTAATAIITDASGRLLMAAQREMRTLTSDGVNQTYPLRLNNSQIQPESLLKDKSNGLWIGTLAQGLVHVHSGKMDSYTPADGLSGGGLVWDLFQDREGSIWVATIDGLDRFHDIAVPTISAKQGLSNNYVMSVLGGRDGSLWVATRDGLNQMKDGEFTVYRKKQGKIGLIHLRPNGTHMETISWEKMGVGPAVSVAVDPARGGGGWPQVTVICGTSKTARLRNVTVPAMDLAKDRSEMSRLMRTEQFGFPLKLV